MAKPNYAFEKRQRDLAKKKKKEEKRAHKEEPAENPPAPQWDRSQHRCPTPGRSTPTAPPARACHCRELWELSRAGVGSSETLSHLVFQPQPGADIMSKRRENTRY